jgi:hypothetical protein
MIDMIYTYLQSVDLNLDKNYLNREKINLTNIQNNKKYFNNVTFIGNYNAYFLFSIIFFLSSHKDNF